MPAIMILALGDSISHMFGVRFGKTMHPLTDKKFLEGSIAGFGENTVIVTPSFAKIHKEVVKPKEEKKSRFD